MKRFILLLSLCFAAGYNAFSQCDTPLTLPYQEDAETANVPELPGCMYSGYLTFASSELFKTTSGPVEGFTGNVIAYNTALDPQMPEGIGTAVTLGSGAVELNAGTFYRVSYKYGMSNPEGVIGIVRLMMVRSFNDYIYLPEQENVPAGTPATFTSEPFTPEDTDTYSLTIEVHLLGNQGFLYLDDIVIEEVAAASVQENNFKNVTVYPNPVKNAFNLANADGIESVTLYNITGQKVFTQKVNSNDVKINTETLAPGVYCLKLHSGTAQKTMKIIKE